MLTLARAIRNIGGSEAAAATKASSAAKEAAPAPPIPPPRQPFSAESPYLQPAFGQQGGGTSGGSGGGGPSDGGSGGVGSGGGGVVDLRMMLSWWFSGVVSDLGAWAWVECSRRQETGDRRQVQNLQLANILLAGLDLDASPPTAALWAITMSL